MSDDDQNLTCSFCSKGRKDVTKMIVGASKVCICNECIKLCDEISKNGIISISEKFTWEKTAESVESVYSKYD